MCADHIAARNRSNAQKSTGPKTARGKAVVAGNARKHGVTGRPDPDCIQAWLAIILNQPDIGLADLMPDDDRGTCALVLAEAEVRLAVVEDALRASKNEPYDVPKTIFAQYKESEDILQLAEELMAFEQTSKRGFRINIRIVNDKYGARTTGVSLRENRSRILLRYLAEAKSRRRRAFAAWIAMEAHEKAYQEAFSQNKASASPCTRPTKRR
jgi:hypothetical protein